jgi:hypothetical protein
VIAQELVRELLAMGNKTQTCSLVDLATRAGLLN